MLRSMTGYGEGEVQAKGVKVKVEARSLNHRFCEIGVRILRKYGNLEGRIRKLVQKELSRGRIDLFINIEEIEEKELEVNFQLAKGYVKAFSNLQKRLGLKGELNIDFLSKIPEIIRIKENKETKELEYYQKEAGKFKAEKKDGEWVTVEHDSKNEPLFNFGTLPNVKFGD